MYRICVCDKHIFLYHLVGLALSQLSQLPTIRPRAYSRLFKYIQHTVGFTENSDWTPHLLRPVLSFSISVSLSTCSFSNLYP